MKRYFGNPELRMSSVLLLFISILFMTVTIFTLKLYHDNLKVDYIKTLGAVTAKVSEKNPQLGREIIPLITKEVTKQDEEKGKIILKQYGLTSKLENQLFPYVNETSIKDIYSIITIFILMAILFFILNYLQYAYFYERIRRLTFGAKRVLEGEYDIAISEDKEGDMSKLSASFNSMRGIIRNNLDELRKEKQFLVDLLSDISHQLKTPLSSMIIYNDILLNKELSKDQSNTFLVSNRNQLYRMNWLIKSILKLARIDAKAVEFNKENQSLNETIEDSIEALDSKASEAKVEIDFKKNRQVIFPHDSKWIQEALINIIKNSIEHSKENGKINVYLDENPIYRRITIEDNGEGISERDLPNIFKRFYKAKTSNNSESIGIGLALSKSIIEAHDGIIEARSNIFEGTRFIITFLKY
ncbi:sensor protein ResE [Clostridium pasteurianum DSM 525 = ATCC 6013]|uniref:histidine kinase n=1 Tax=Clostridium pasteurianum DSM 525 = ATCC 6013 TaxID=1262449 RepID=A0A0H3J5J4_CLOPA|nr:HAMP domain-containing sensor histidine kinase [Clostridium pasteurianum]AJA49271.1 sensor protein ResE [Clostridium pasteurianum DSM 525 = ATCC 6013]AJA53259.1 sensor protein ResE [Clostridium pasteurianum DSM 525 = ATCC 6013]AOZ76449.1 histidine kinase [Clostridium pasteurianum DSM 525 = ATCC 6013]AOZ80246.1 histidine kinase [Clostridium pasteurianum]ELP58291.1 sensor protein ResE [Clostridium pasteurianum DSM 525 = ATCC 6013]